MKTLLQTGNVILPIKDFKEAVVAVAAGIVFGIDTSKSKKFEWDKALVLSAKLNAGVEGYENILPQAFDIDTDEGAEVVAAVVAELAIDSEAAKGIVIAAVEALPPMLKLYKAVEFAVRSPKG